MKALRFHAVNEPFSISDVERPEPDADEVLIKIAGCGICHTDIGFWKDGVPTKQKPPLTLGHEISGTVVDAGENFKSMVSAEVLAPAVFACGSCVLCKTGRANICQHQIMPGNDFDGGFAEYFVAPGRGLCKIQDKGKFKLSELSVIADAITTPLQAIVRSGLQRDELAIVIGVGGVGAFCAQIASAVGARVIAIDVSAKKLGRIGRHGADLCLNAAESDFKEIKNRIRETAKAWGIGGFSWKIFECSGTPNGQQTAFGLLTPASTLLIIGFTLAKGEYRLSNLMALDAAIIGSWGCPSELYPRAVELATSGEINLEDFIECFPMSQGPSVLQQAAEHKLDRRAILVPDWK